MKLFVDIETLPAMSWTDEQIRDYAREAVPGNYKKQDSIDAWVDENSHDQWLRTALKWEHGQICAIGYAFEDGDPDVIVADTTADVLRIFFDTLDDVIGRPMWAGTQWIGHNIAFDLTWIHHHTAKEMPEELGKIPFDKWLKSCSDTMLMWQGPGREFTGLDKICQFLGLGGKAGDGSQVYDLYMAGEIDQLKAYCAQDVALTRALFKRLGG
jgi:hypothetical protein